MLKNPSHPRKGQLRNKQCPFTKAGIEYIDYKDVATLNRFTNDQGKILPRRITGVTAYQQRQVATAIKHARHLALMPFVAQDIA